MRPYIRGKVKIMNRRGLVSSYDGIPKLSIKDWRGFVQFGELTNVGGFSRS